MIDIVIPVYEGAEQTRRCIESVLASASVAPREIVVVDDATPNPAVARHLDELARADKVTLLRNEANAGFVRSVNRGMALHADRDVILLNSDTEVANDWVERLAAAARSAPDIGTVTPFSNNATICSYPGEGWREGVPGTLGLAALDRLFARTNRGIVVDLPTAVGFCMYIRRDCLAAVGAFDAERFGRGYGEENDFCLRAAAVGWRNVLACDVFVFHEGAVSFAAERDALVVAATRALLERHPGYTELVRKFIGTDPAAGARAAVDMARASLGPEESAAVIAERRWERDRMASRIKELEDHVRTFENALAQAKLFVEERTTQVRERDAALDERDREIARLHEGLSHAESLAFGRERELQRIRAFRLWRYYDSLMRRFAPSKPPDP